MDVDAETRSAVSLATGAMVVEGRFLDEVLAGVSVALIRLTCGDVERSERFTMRGVLDPSSVCSSDRDDSDLRTRLYGRTEQALDCSTIDTTYLTPEAVVERVITILQS